MTDTPTRFLIFNNGMIGNTLFNMPAAAWLKQTFPGCFVGMVVDTAGLDLVGKDPHVDVFYTFNKKKDSLMDQFRLVLAFRQAHYDVSLHLRKGVRNELLARLSGVKLRAGYRLKGSPQHLHIKLDEDTSVHRLESRALLIQAALNRDVILKRPKLHPHSCIEDELDCILEKAGTERGGYFVLHPTGDSQGGISWSLPVHAAVVAGLKKHHPVFIICMPHERPGVEKAIPSDANVHYYTGSIATTSQLIRAARVFIGNDSGPAHIACAWDTKRVVIYHDNTSNFIKWQPVNMTGCAVVFRSALTPEKVIEEALKLDTTEE